MSEGPTTPEDQGIPFSQPGHARHARLVNSGLASNFHPSGRLSNPRHESRSVPVGRVPLPVRSAMRAAINNGGKGAPSDPARRGTDEIIPGSGADLDFTGERLFGHQAELYTASDYGEFPAMLLHKLVGLPFLYFDKATGNPSVGSVRGRSLSPPALLIRLPGTPHTSKASLKKVFKCMARFQDCPVDMQQRLRFNAETADAAMMAEQQALVLAAELANQKLKLLNQANRSHPTSVNSSPDKSPEPASNNTSPGQLPRASWSDSGATRATIPDSALFEDLTEAQVFSLLPPDFEPLLTFGQFKESNECSDGAYSTFKKYRANWILERDDVATEALALIRRQLPQTSRLAHSKPRRSAPTAGCYKNPGHPTPASQDPDKGSPNQGGHSSDSDYATSPSGNPGKSSPDKDTSGQSAFGSPPVSRNDLLIPSNMSKAKNWIGVTVCIDHDAGKPPTIAVVISANTRRTPPTFRCVVAGKAPISLSLDQTFTAACEFAALPDALKPGSKASEVVGALADAVNGCPKHLTKKFSAIHQEALSTAEGLASAGALVNLRSFTDGGKGVAWLEVVQQIKESDARALTSFSATTSVVNELLESKNLMMSHMEVANWLNFQFDLHCALSLCPRTQSNPRTPNPDTKIGVNSYLRKPSNPLSIENIKEAIETLATIFTPLFGFTFAMKNFRCHVMAAIDEARQLVPTNPVAAANTAFSWCMRTTAERIKASIKEWKGSDSQVPRLPNSPLPPHPIDDFKFFGDVWEKKKMLLLMPIINAPSGSAGAGATSQPDGRSKHNTRSTGSANDHLWHKPPLNQYNPGKTMLGHAQEWWADNGPGTAFKDWATCINYHDKRPGNSYGPHRHQKKCMLRDMPNGSRCFGISKCARCFVQTQWDLGIKKPPNM